MVILEGEKEVILELYDRIKLDARHKEVKLFSDDPITERTFPDWGMAFYPVDKHVKSQNELVQFKRNLAMLSDLMDNKSLTAHLFWRRVKIHVDGFIQ